MSETNVVDLFEKIDEQTMKVQESESEPYLDSLAMCMEVLFYGTFQREVSTDVKESIETPLQQIDLSTYNTADIHKAIQLTIIKGMQKTTQHQHAITPETIALFIGYLAEKLMKGKESIRIFDPVGGTGNLLVTVLDYLKQETSAYASEVDTTLLRIALMYANLLKKEVEFFHQDSLRPLLLDPVDLVVADLPVGYYPDDVQAETFELRKKDGHSYAHHLLIEQSLHYTKAGGYLVFVIPEHLFSTEESDTLNAFLQQHAHIIGIIQLAESTFKSKEHKKSIFILRKKGEETKDVKQPLLVQLPSFKDTNAMEDIMNKINQWFQEAELHQ
ncbi:MAG TPA: class I SAM-dependent methyltransferase [Pseudogracilibacillus sp.]|nr:class I SAM-dependent methyltransferase [Pseudogracilibacillus sp.]